MSKNKKATDPARFEGNGISYRAKVIGIEDVPEARGDKMCQEMIQKLKTAVKASGQHKQRVFVNVTLDGLRIYDAVAMTLQHTHPVHQISFISRDVTDSRAFGYIYGPGDGTHKFFGIKTANAAENLVLALRDLFQTVYEMKKKEMEEAKLKAAAGQESPEGQGDNPDTTYQVPPNGAPVEGQDNIYQGIEQIKNLEFDDLPADEAPRQATSPTASPTSPATSDPWGVSAGPAASGTGAGAAAGAAPASSALSDLQQLQQAPPPTSNPFGGMQAFPGTPAPSVGISASGGPFALGQPGGMAFMTPGQQPLPQPAMGLPVTKDPFGDDPFSAMAAQQQQRAPVPQAGMPFAPRPGFMPGQPFPGAVAPGNMPVQGFGVAAAAPGFAPFGLASPPVMGMGVGVGMGMRGSPQPPAQPADPNMLQPLKPGGQQQEEEPRSKSPKPALFGDLVDIKKAGDESAAKSPKELFKELSAPPKKSLNEIKVEAKSPTAEVEQASDGLDLAFTTDPFGSLDTVLDTSSAAADPFDTSHIAAPLSHPPPLPPPSLMPPPPAPPDPAPHPAHKKTVSDSDSGSQKESSPEDRFDMPDEPPPPLPSHLQISTSAPAPPPRPAPRDRVEPPVPQRPRPRPRRSVSSSSASSATSPLSSSLPPSVQPPPLPPSVQPPPLPSSPRPLSRTESSPADTSVHNSVPSTADPGPAVRSDLQGASLNSSSSILHEPPSPSRSLDSSLSHASSQKSLSERTLNPSEEEDPFGVPLRSKRSSTSDGARKSNRSSSKSNTGSDPKLAVPRDSNLSSGGLSDPFADSDPKLAVMLESKLAVSTDPFGVNSTILDSRPGLPDSVDPFGVPLSKKNPQQKLLTESDNPFSANAFGDAADLASSGGKWVAFGEGQTNGSAFSDECEVQSEKQRKPAPGGDSAVKTASPFGDSFLAPTSATVNGKPQGQS